MPVLPDRASLIFSRLHITELFPVFSANLMAALTFGAMLLPSPNWPFLRWDFISRILTEKVFQELQKRVDGYWDSVRQWR